ncbi:MAG: hypothetical protein WC479_00700 [Candidatus Izemoplasmatales bacterium]
MLIIAYSDNQGYLNMVRRLENMCKSDNLPFKAYDRGWLVNHPEFTEHPEIFSTHKGGGYWTWKPLIILDALKLSEEVLYLDSSVVYPNREAILRIFTETKLLSAVKTSFINKDWTKRSCFRDMDCDTEEYWDTTQVWAGVVCAKRQGIGLIEEWREYCLNYRTVSDTTSKDNFPTFKAHRHDQSILTNILTKHKQPCVEVTGFHDNNFSDLLRIS